VRDVIVFDVNETLLDVGQLRPRFEEVLPASLMSLWFTKMLHNSLVANSIGLHAPFDQQGTAALIAVGSAHGVDIARERAARVVEGMIELPAHSDVVPALEMLSRHGFRLAALTNSSQVYLDAQIEHAGLTHYFASLLSVDAVQLFKPAPQTYRYAADQLGVPIGRTRLIAAHDWDVSGAIRAGAKAGFVSRTGQALGALSEVPDLIADSMVGVAEQIVADAGQEAAKTPS